MLVFGAPFLVGEFGNRHGAASPAGPSMPRRAISPTATILFAGHSFVQTAYGTPLNNGTPEAFGGILQTDWPGTALSDFVSFGSMQQVWELDGHLRNAAYDTAILSEVTFDFANGFPAVDSSATRTTLQHLYWAGLTAQARGAEIILHDVWSPLGGDLTANVHSYFQFLREWLQDKLQQPVWIVPASAFVMALRNEYGGAIYEDGLHLGRSSPYARGMSYLVYSMLTQSRYPFVVARDEAIDQLAWDILLTYECAGMGGPVGHTPASGDDPLPVPE